MIAEFTPPVNERNVTITMTETEARKLRRLVGWNIAIPEVMYKNTGGMEWGVKELLDSINYALIQGGVRSE